MGTKRCAVIHLSILLTLLSITNQTEFGCKSLNHTCQCIKSAQNGDLELYCPNITDYQATIEYSQDNSVRLTCRGNMIFEGLPQYYAKPFENYNFLPKLSTASLNELKIVDCSLKNETVSTLLNLMEVQKVSIVNMDRNMDVVLKSNYFESISRNLEQLSLANNGITKIPPEIFDGMNNLTFLDLNDNEIVLVDYQFNGLTQLTLLDLSRNHILRLPKYTFKNLQKLIRLHLWNNHIRELDEELFADQISLKSLELSGNQISNLPEGVFSNLINLSKINLGNNNITTIPAGMFRNNKLLTSIRLEGNKLERIPDSFFANFENLENVSLNSCMLKDLPDNLFSNSKNIARIKLQNNSISAIPKNLFDGLGKLEILYLDHNRLTYISDDIFKNNPALLELTIDYNFININISRTLLSKANKLQILKMNNNQIEAIDLFALNNNSDLTDIDLSNNRITLDDGNNGLGPFNNCVKLKTLNLRNNSISFMLFLTTNGQLSYIDMSFNKITYLDFSSVMIPINQIITIDLSNNLISEVYFESAEASIKEDDLQLYDARSSSDKFSRKVILNNNPMTCDCKSYDLLRYFNLTINDAVRTMIDIKADNLYCAAPENFVNISVQTVWPSKVTCDVDECPKNCDCAYRPYKSTFIVDCSGRNMSQAPIIEGNSTYNRVEMYLQDNLLTEVPMDDVNVLDLSNNLLTNITRIPSNLEVLHLHNNHIQRLNNDILSKLNMTVTLHENPWICDCAALNLSHYIRDKIIMHKNKIRCNLNGPELKLQNDNDLCPTSTTLVLYIAIGTAIAMTIAAVITALYYKFDQEIKIWMYANNICLALVTEEDLDKDKKYDGFLSFSHVDENFVIEELATKLESGPYPYKLCIHTRNFIPGEFIATQITDSVRDSRRTIVVLSPSFLDSVWGKMEFRAAHAQALSEKRTRVIVILYGDIDPNSNIIDDEMKTYLKTNTYIKWGDPWFWDKLRYALPHNPKKGKKKFENISVNLDKMDLINGNLTPNVTSTPPAHPLLLKGNPLDFKAAESMHNTPPAEAGFDLVITTTN